MFELLIAPAYGADYKDAAACRSDWEAGKDFRIVNGPCCSNRDEALILRAGFNKVTFTGRGGAALLSIRLDEDALA